MDLKGLSELTGQKSISEMTDAELHEHLRVIRQSRLVTKGREVKLVERKPKASKQKLPDLSDISPDKLDELASLLGV